MIFLNVTISPAARRFLFIVPAVIASFGIQSLYVYFTNVRPVEISIEQLVSNPPRAKWIRVTGGRVNLIDAVVSETGLKKKIDGVYVPVLPQGKGESEAVIVLHSTDPEVLALAGQLHSLGDAGKGEVEGLKLVMENARLVVQNRSFEGLIQSGLSRNDRVAIQLRKKIPNIAREPIILEEGKKPSIFEGLGILLFAGVTLVGVVSVPKPKLATPPPLPPMPPSLPRSN